MSKDTENDSPSNALNSSTSSSSTLAELDETSLLLAKDRTVSKERSVLALLRSSLMYQPANIESSQTTFPANSTSLLILVLLGINIFYLVYKIEFSVFLLFVAADRASIMFVANLPWLYILSAKNQPVKRLTGMSYENLNIYHRRLGELMCLLGFWHAIGMFFVWVTLLRPVGFTFLSFALSKVTIFGTLALILYQTIFYTSLSTVRHAWYEFFLGMHVSFQIGALLFLFLHHSRSRIYVGITLGIFIIDRIIYRLVIKTTYAEAALKVMEDKQTARLSVNVSPRQPSLLKKVFGADIRTGWKATDHVFISIPSLSWKDKLTSHPFTIASSHSNNNGNTQLDLIIRAETGFSRDLLCLAERSSKAMVRLDGPYGSQNAVSMLKSCDAAAVIAGGSGIAVIWPLIWEVLRLPQDESSTQLRLLFVWVVHDDSHHSWLGKSALDQLSSKGVELVLPEATFKQGRPDIAGLIRAWIIEQEGVGHQGRPKIGVVCSGPDGLNRAVRNSCAAMVRRGYNVDVEIEKFGW
ncbi:MAG: hypothetical protein M1814_006545 [Vezdaea aestivalis]|nr:MAG: hypothetical protein M1814_006545 [Vezdaea aestivalis]